MEQFITMADLAVFGTLVTIVFAITNFVKELPYVKSIPTRYLSWGIAVVLILLSNIALGTFEYWSIMLYPISAIFVSTSANGLADFNKNSNKKKIEDNK